MSLNTLIFSLGIGSVSKCLGFASGNVLMTQHCTIRLLNKKDKFLLGLNKDLDEVRGKIMGMKPLPTIREAFLEV